MDGESRQIITEQMLERCALECIAAKLVIANSLELLKEDELLDPVNVGEKLGRCVLGPTTVGRCSTEKTVCRHPSASHTQDTNEQVIALAEYIL
jgi:hypothetical protein